ncbi:ribonuclease HII [Kamptonema cortianum]|nr:ribonuclease HII [Oscillatoria laete-virens]MDK3160270.1 ribonuclease HII [Kamptonema cortianum]MDL5048379.1 ribonuclease HII [Oscillatoria amoena NRMC-F 0135]MDL5054256.1 ribonuclease HII [Oscillatoria laete-virens NRMC-F 0139]
MPPTLDFEKAARAKGFVRIAGIDEAGRGPWAGPVTAAAVILPEQFAHARLNDSKQLPEKKREEIFDELMANSQIIKGVGLASAEEIDSLNILRATHLAMRRAVEALANTPDFLLIDGRPVKDSFSIAQQAIVKGDSKSLSIAAASILAKVTRDRLMLDIDHAFPQYGFAQHKGYGTAAHAHALTTHGPCPVHRRSFAPVRTALAQKPL